MLSYPEPIQRKKYIKPKLPSATPTPVGPLTLLSATVVGFQDTVLVVSLVFNTTEDDPLVDGAHDASQWTATLEGTAFTGSSVEAGDFNVLELIMPPGGDEGASGRINYAASPSDIGDLSGRMLGPVVAMELSQE